MWWSGWDWQRERGASSASGRPEAVSARSAKRTLAGEAGFYPCPERTSDVVVRVGSAA